MEMIPISESKLKVMLSRKDLEEYELDTEQLDYGNRETRLLFREILESVKEEIGFDTDGYRVLVQLFPSRDGGCEMFITKIGSIHCERETEREKGEGALLHYKPSHRPTQNKGSPGAFGFEQLEWMITVCRRLLGIGYTGRSTAYISDDRRFYLFLEGLDPTGYLPLDEYSFIAEYGKAENVEALHAFLSEHGHVLCEGEAVERLGVL